MAAACESQGLVESATSSRKPVDQTNHSSSFSELFGDLNSKHNSLPIPYLCSLDSTNKNHTKNLCFSFPLGNKNDVGLQLCTEGLGSESSDDVEDFCDDILVKDEKFVSSCVKHHVPSAGRRSGMMMSREAWPPPLSFIGRSGKSGVLFKSFRQNGRFVLKEVRIPTQEFLQAHREDGRLKLQFVQPNEEDEDDEDEELGDDVQEENDVGNVSNNGQPLSFVV